MSLNRVQARMAIIAASAVLATLLIGAPSAAARSASFKPVHVTRASVAFKPHAPANAKPRRAKVRFRSPGRVITRHIGTRRLSKAISHGSKIKVRNPPVIRRRHGGVRRRALLHVRFRQPQPPATVGSSCSFGSFGPASLPGACWRPYSDTSPFNRELPAEVPQPADSAQIAKRIADFGAGPQIVTGVADTTADYEHPIYYSTPTDPAYTVHCTQPWGTCEAEGEQIRIPARARAAGGPDAHLAVIDQASGTEYDFWDVEKKPAGGGTLTVGWGGKTAIGTTDSDGLDSNATAAHFGLAAGIIRPAELARGEIDHALAIAVKCTNGTSVAPAGSGTGRVCSDMGLSNRNAPAMGEHLFLDKTPAEISAMDAPKWRKAIFTAMAKYGMYVEDTGADANGWALIVESGSSYTSFGQPDPWVQLAKRSTGVDSWYSSDLGRQLYSFNLQHVTDWGSSLRVADPCVGTGSC